MNMAVKSKRTSAKKTNTLAHRLIDEFELVRDREFIRFKDGPSTLTNTLTSAAKSMALKYGGSKLSEPVELVHYSSFMKNPLRYIFKMISVTEVSKATKSKREATVHEIVRQAMEEDPLTTVRLVVFSMARVAKF